MVVLKLSRAAPIFIDEVTELNRDDAAKIFCLGNEIMEEQSA